MSKDAIEIWDFSLKLDKLNWWKTNEKEFVTNCSAINAFFTWSIWICVEVSYYFIEIVMYLILLAIIILLVKSIISGSLQTFCKLAKEIFYTVLSSPRFFWALFVSYILGTPFRPPVDSSGANKDLGDKFEREENSKTFLSSH